MSTKRLEEALDYLENNPTAGEAQAVRRAARKELEAIQKAAKVLTECDMDLFPRGTLTPEDAQGAMDVLLAIAKEGS